VTLARAAARAASNELEDDVAQTSIQQELNRAPNEPLLPVEKKLIGWSLGIGVVLLVVLALFNHFAPATF
jgi:hypothetical protein